MVNLFVVTLDITVVINISQEIIKALDEKMLKALSLYVFHKYTSKKHNSLNDHFNLPQMNE